jgi:hypothetical protein
MKNLINFKKFSINESDSQQLLNQENIDSIKRHLTGDVLDGMLKAMDEESIEVLRLQVPFIYDMLLDRANSKGISIEKILHANKISRFL